jgi:hypothetical protein
MVADSAVNRDGGLRRCFGALSCIPGNATLSGARAFAAGHHRMTWGNRLSVAGRRALGQPRVARAGPEGGKGAILAPYAGDRIDAAADGTAPLALRPGGVHRIRLNEVIR